MDLRLPYLNKIKAHGKAYWYYRREGENVPLEGAPGEPGFLASYDKVNAQFSGPSPSEPEPTKAGSLKALIREYKAKSAEYKKAAPSTKRAYDRYLTLLSDGYGDLSVRKMPRSFVFELRDKYSDKPRTANYIVQVLRFVMQFGVDRDWRATNPASKPKLLKSRREGHRPFEESEISDFRAKWSLATIERTCFEILINSGQRIGDVAAMRRKHRGPDGIAVAQEKTKARVWVPETTDLNEALEAYLATHKGIALLVNSKGHPWSVSGLQHVMRAAYRAAGLPDEVTNHGGRYTAATVLHELDCDWDMIASITGQKTVQMVRHYIRKKRNARLAIDRLNAARESGSRTKVQKTAD